MQIKFSGAIDVHVAGKLGVHLSADSSGILKLDKAESVIEVWETYEVDVPVESTQENQTIEARETLESGSEQQVGFIVMLCFQARNCDHIWLPDLHSEFPCSSIGNSR